MHLYLHQQGGLDGLSRPRFCSPTRPMKEVGRLVHGERHSGRHFVGLVGSKLTCATRIASAEDNNGAD